ncbi:MAG TPA: hypothetical protein VFX22_07795 [Candidatus Kapabacteria bacterium]|nr:hypothetical protein [Candidatus Kapabacteria bacterium]
MFIGNKSSTWIVAALAAILLVPMSAFAQKRAPTSKKPKASVSVVKPPVFRPTCNLDSNSVGFYFYPANLGAKWTLRTISQVLDASNKVLKSDTTFSFEQIISDSNRTIQGFPVLICLSSMPYHAGEDSIAKVKHVEYYIDDSVIMTVFNHSITSELNHFMLVNPLQIGASWKDLVNDTIRSTILATQEPVSVPYGSFSNALVVNTPTGFGEMSKYFVPGVGIVKVVFRGIPPQANGTFVVTTELVALDPGNPRRNIKYRFQAPRAR